MEDSPEAEAVFASDWIHVTGCLGPFDEAWYYTGSTGLCVRKVRGRPTYFVVPLIGGTLETPYDTLATAKTVLLLSL